jgi:hypothetical protein
MNNEYICVRFLTWISDNHWSRRNRTHPNKVGQYYSDIHCEYKTIEQLYKEFNENLNQEFNKIEMEKMTKKYEYRGYTYTIDIALNTKVKTSISGERWHTITLNDSTEELKKWEEVKDKYLEITIEDFKRFAQKFFDKTIDGVSNPIDRLSKLGFTSI